MLRRLMLFGLGCLIAACAASPRGGFTTIGATPQKEDRIMEHRQGDGDVLKFGESAGAGLQMASRSEDGIEMQGRYHIEHRRNGVLLEIIEVENLITNEGKNHTLATELAAGTPITAWYVGLKGTGTAAAGDTLASHAGWSEITAYSGNRKAWTPGSVASQSVSNSASPAVFSITGTATVSGLFLGSAATGTTGTMFSAVNFTGGDRAVQNGDTLTVTYTVSA